MANKNYANILQLNVTGMSSAKQVLLNKYIDDAGADFIALNETKKELPEDFFINHRTFSQQQTHNQGGVSLSLPKETSCFEIHDLQSKNFDSVWCAVNFYNLSFRLAAAYIPPIADTKMKEFLSTLDEAKSYAKLNNMKGVLFVGDPNARNLLWGDIRNNTSGSLLEQYIEEESVEILNDGQPTFYSINGSSVIDIFMTTEELCGWKTTMYTDLNTELLTGYPNRGHVPVFPKWELNYPSQDGIVTKFDLENTDWQNWQSILEEKINSFTHPNNLLYKDPNVAWRKMRYILEEVNQLCLNTKVISKHSKPFWTDVLTQLSNEVRALNKTFKRTSTTQNHAALTSARLWFKQELSTAASNWTSSKLKEINNAKHYNSFWRNIQKVFPNKKDQMVAPLRSQSGLCFDEPDKQNYCSTRFSVVAIWKKKNLTESLKTLWMIKCDILIF